MTRLIRWKGKQVKILCELVTVNEEYSPKKPLRNREGRAVCWIVSQETCLLLYRNFSKPRVTGRTSLSHISHLCLWCPFPSGNGLLYSPVQPSREGESGPCMHESASVKRDEKSAVSWAKSGESRNKYEVRFCEWRGLNGKTEKEKKKWRKTI